ncbi:MAG TPA: caspase family protein, partial [Chitinophagaceae bacterium]|nr:caspase family protein [Chitinophagaceae bacterium]
GISRYQYIDSLEFADADAKVFADYLLSNSFWRISKDDITLLVNDKAKYGDLTVHLQQLAMQCKPGDNLLFYFSGHGDVET